MAKEYHIATLQALQATNLGSGFISGSGQGGKLSADYKTVTIDDASFSKWQSSTPSIITFGTSPVETAIQKVPDLSISPSPGDISNIMAIVPFDSGSGVGTSYFYFFPNEVLFIENAWKIPNFAGGGTIGSSPYNTNDDAINAVGTVGGVTIYYDNNLLEVIARGGA
jgi:hypothetical protein